MLLFILMLLSLGGCWDRQGLNDLAIVVGAGIDQKDDKTIQLSVQMIVPGAVAGGQQSSGGRGGGVKEKTTFVQTSDGVTVSDAMTKLQEKVSRRIFWGHNRVIIIGEKLAKSGIRSQLDFFSRFPRPRLRAFVFVSKEKPEEVLAILPVMERSMAEELRELADFKIGISVTVKELLEMLSSEAEAAALPWIEIAPISPGQQEPTDARVNGTAVFKKGKMVGRIDDQITRGLLMVRDEIERSTVTITPKEANGFISFQIIDSSIKLIPEIENGQWKMRIKLNMEDDVVHNGTNLDMMSPTIIKRLQKELNEDVKNRVIEALGRVQKEMKTDIFGFADAFHRKYPKEWAQAKERWDEIFPTVQVTVDSKVYIRRPGTSSIPQGLPEKEVKKK
jgi:spore germination protein KC